ncbi:hypothetical protein [Stackebrandtia nassauensis]|uniref:Uncharacterized protein n=1 Tax=Stackebrandtia nassauensis (strain DSM 44728 / CIP 108903 / NRRL B-16338 / NBRC 102104 / LLR-40K-21) TaxID=446470 RepID=D3Q8F9_STANL|nr:hypothetical protein [Stackebrandtia nassauensis]ADD42533.1 hypothetical protein Snas_2858 [Stackebrandtia nassauensis DSM 44728]
MTKRFGGRWWLVGAITVAVAGLAATTLTVIGSGDSGNGGDSASLSKLDTKTVPPDAGSCDVELLDWPAEGEPGFDLKMSPNGEYIVTDTPGSSDFVMWHNGKLTVVSDVPGEGDASVSGVNSQGVVIGTRSGSDGSTAYEAWRYEDGEASELRGSGGSAVLDLAAVNDEGTIVAAEPAGSSSGDDLYGNGILTWAPGDTEATTVSLSTTTSGRAPTVRDMSNDGTLVGGQFSEEMMDAAGEGDYQARMWDSSGKATAIPIGEYDALASDVAGDWVIASGESNSYRLTTTAKPVPEKLGGFTATAVDTSGRAYGGVVSPTGEDENGDGIDDDPDQHVPGVFDSKARPLPVVEDVKPLHQDVPYGLDIVTAASEDGAKLAGNWKGNPVMWTCG